MKSFDMLKKYAEGKISLDQLVDGIEKVINSRGEKKEQAIEELKKATEFDKVENSKSEKLSNVKLPVTTINSIKNLISELYQQPSEIRKVAFLVIENLKKYL